MKIKFTSRFFQCVTSRVFGSKWITYRQLKSNLGKEEISYPKSNPCPMYRELVGGPQHPMTDVVKYGVNEIYK